MSVSIDQIFGTGLAVTFIGVILLVTTRLQFFRGFMAIRRQLIQQANAAGEIDRAAKLAHELHVCEVRLPRFAFSFICAGFAIMLICAVLLLRGTSTI